MPSLPRRRGATDCHCRLCPRGCPGSATCGSPLLPRIDREWQAVAAVGPMTGTLSRPRHRGVAARRCPRRSRSRGPSLLRFLWVVKKQAEGPIVPAAIESQFVQGLKRTTRRTTNVGTVRTSELSEIGSRAATSFVS